MMARKKTNGTTGKEMRKYYYNILALMALLMACGCSDDTEQSQRGMHLCVQAGWQAGRSLAGTRALSDDILTDDGGSIAISPEYYPETIDVKDENMTDYIFTKNAVCNLHAGYITYVPMPAISDIANRTFSATATIDDEDTLEGTVSGTQDGHAVLQLNHTKALLRLAFKVSEKYDKLRQVKITDVKLNGKTCKLADKVLKQTGQYIAYTYIDPSVVTPSSTNTLVCTYYIYDKDADLSNAGNDNSSHLTREEVTATNTFTLGGTDSSITEVAAGKYYDFIVTLNPEFLYILFEHDNKDIVVE